jgi:hypothetical protein
LKTEIRNLLSSGVNLSIVISVDFLPKDLLSRFDIGNIFSDTNSNQPVLKPTVRALHFSFGLRRQGIGDFHITIIEDLFPLRGGLISQEVVFSPIGVPPLDKSEDGMGVYIVTVRESVFQDDRLEGQDMSPGGFLFDQSGIKDQAAIVIQGSDEIPFLLGRWCPEMIGGVMLDQFPHVTGQDFSVMEGPFGFLEIEAMLFSSTNHGGQGDFLTIFLPQVVLDKAVVIGFQRDLFILDDPLFNRQFSQEILFNLWRNSCWGGPLILDREMFRIFPILVDEREEPSFLDSQDLLNIGSLHFFL